MRRGCWRRLLLLIALALTIFLLAEVAPRLLIHSNVEAFADLKRTPPPGEQGPAMSCVEQAYLLGSFGGSPEGFVRTALRVVDVMPLPQEELRGCEYECPYEFKIRVYTVFGIPYDTIVATCSHAYRLYDEPLGRLLLRPPQ